MLTTNQLNEILEKASKATKGPWHGVIPTHSRQINDSWIEISNDERNNKSTDNDYDFIASVNPTVVQEIITRLIEAEKCIEQICSTHTDIATYPCCEYQSKYMKGENNAF